MLICKLKKQSHDEHLTYLDFNEKRPHALEQHI